MPLYPRRWEDHHPIDGKAPHDEHVVLLTGSLAIGSVHRLKTRWSGGRYRRVVGLSAGPRRVAGRTAFSIEEGMTLRHAASVGMIAGAGLAERADAKPAHRIGACRGLTCSEAAALDAFSTCWAAWIEWAGLRQMVELRCDS